MAAFERLVRNTNIVAMKDSHRTPEEFGELKRIIKDQVHVFVNTPQYLRFAPLGAAGCWSFDVWMAPWPVLRLRDAIERGDLETAKAIAADLSPGGGAPQASQGGAPPHLDLTWRETLAKIAIGLAGYCDPGPLRPPFIEIPADVMERAKARASQWQALGQKYGPVGARGSS